jgi:predicted XRE-type DNA-binding protein
MNSIALQSMFDPITDCPQEASELETRADLMISIRDIINDKGWTLKETAQIFGLTQTRINDLKEGRSFR